MKIKPPPPPPQKKKKNKRTLACQSNATSSVVIQIKGNTSNYEKFVNKITFLHK